MKYLLLFAGFSFYHSAFAQKQGQPLIDSLLNKLPEMREDSNKVKLLGEIAKAYMLVNPKGGFAYAERGLQLAEKINWKRGIAKFHNNLGLMIGDSGNNTLSRVHFEKAYILNKELHLKFDLINNLNNIGRSYQRESDFSKAMEYFLQAMTIAGEMKNSEQIALVATNITAGFYAQQNYNKAGIYAEMALKNAETANARSHMAKALLQLGYIKMAIKDSAAAKKYLARSLRVNEEMNNKPAMAQVLSAMAELEYPDYKKEIEIMLKVKKIADETNPSSLVSIGNLDNLGQTYYNLALQSRSPDKDIYLKKAGDYLLQAKVLAEQTSNAEYLANISVSLADLEEVKGHYKTALDYYKTFNSINDSLFSQDKKNEIAGLEGKHNLDLKDNEIAINKLMLSDQRKTQGGLLAGLLLFGIIGGLLYWQSRNRKRTNTTLMVLNNQLDEANKIKAKFFGILSHDLRSPVVNLVNFLHLQKNDPDLLSEERRKVHQQNISDSAEDLLNTMEAMLLWSKEQMENFRPHIKNVPVSALFEYIQKFFAQTGHVNIRFNHTPGLEVSTDENYLRTIMQNLTSNAIKALKNTPDALIEWNARKEGDKIILSVTDNGPGIDDHQAKALFDDSIVNNSKNGFGLHLIRDLAKAIHTKISMQSQPGIGTTFTLSA